MLQKTAKTDKRKSKFAFSPTQLADRILCGLRSDLSDLSSEVDPTQLYMGQFDAKSVFAYRQQTDFLKKFVNESNQKQDTPQAQAAFEKFEANLSRLANFDPALPDYAGGGWAEKPCKRTVILARAKSFLSFVLGPFSLESMFMASRHSNGSTIGVSFQNTSLESKLSFPISATRLQALLMIEYWHYDTLSLRAMLNHSAPIWTLLYELDPLSVFNIVDASEGLTVPKNNLIGRFIAKETTAGMFHQQGIEDVMYQAVLSFCNANGWSFFLDVEKLQQSHRAWAQKASVSGEDATIDWSNASDNWLRTVVKWLLPPDWYEVIECVSTARVSTPSGTYDMPMISTMGNAVTFPLESLLFYSIAISTVSYHYDDSTSVCPDWAQFYRRVSVYGDDCILPVDCTDDFISVLESIGHECNKSKSYTDGSFRESCGGDFLSGVDVRPFMLQWPVSTSSKTALHAWLNICTNRILNRYITCLGPTSVINSSALSVLADIYNEYELKIAPIPDYYPDDAGVKLTDEVFLFSPLSKTCVEPLTYNKRYNSFEVNYLSYSYPIVLQRSERVRYWYGLKYCPTTPVTVTRNSKRKIKLYLDRESPFYVPLEKKQTLKVGGYYKSSRSVVPVWTTDLIKFARFGVPTLLGIDGDAAIN